MFLTKVTVLTGLFNGPVGLYSVSDEVKWFCWYLFKEHSLDGLGISLPAFRFRTNLKLHIIYVTPKVVKKVSPDCNSVVVLKQYGPEFIHTSWILQCVLTHATLEYFEKLKFKKEQKTQL